jgi:hypothetical protein
MDRLRAAEAVVPDFTAISLQCEHAGSQIVICTAAS